MKRSLKKMVFCSLLAVILLSTVGVFAIGEWFYFEVPARQGWVKTTADRGDGVIQSKTDTGHLMPEYSNIPTVTFYAGGYDKDKKDYIYPKAGTIFQHTTQNEAYLIYSKEFEKGTKMRTKARNHEFTFIANCLIHGYIDYN